MIAKELSQKLVLVVIGLTAASGILIPAGYATFHPVTSSEIEDGTIQSVDIGTSQVKAVDIAADAVGASEIQGVSKLLFLQCEIKVSTVVTPGAFVNKGCEVSGLESGDRAIASIDNLKKSGCFAITDTSVFTPPPLVGPPVVNLTLNNVCNTNTSSEEILAVAIIVFHK